jgi:hypothetical protein
MRNNPFSWLKKNTRTKGLFKESEKFKESYYTFTRGVLSGGDTRRCRGSKRSYVTELGPVTFSPSRHLWVALTTQTHACPSSVEQGSSRAYGTGRPWAKPKKLWRKVPVWVYIKQQFRPKDWENSIGFSK